MNFHLPERSEGWFTWNFNTIVTIAGICTTILVNVVFVATTWNDTKRDIKDVQQSVGEETEARKARMAVTDARFEALTKAVAEIQPLSFQVQRSLDIGAENKRAFEAVNARMDGMMNTLGGKMDTVVDTINKVATRVEVLSSKMDDANPRKTEYRTMAPVIRP